MVNKLWHDSREHPKDGSSIIIVHDYFNWGKDQVESVCYYEDYQEHFGGRIYHHYNVFMRYGRSYDYWDKWAWKIKKWCYSEDLLKIE